MFKAVQVAKLECCKSVRKGLHIELGSTVEDQQHFREIDVDLGQKRSRITSPCQGMEEKYNHRGACHASIVDYLIKMPGSVFIRQSADCSALWERIQDKKGHESCG